jgi:hypothetical protein
MPQEMQTQMMRTMLMKIAKGIWVALAVIVLAVSLYGFDGRPNSDVDIFLIWSMLALAFPSSLLVALLLSGVSIAVERLSSTVVPTSYWSIAITWVCFFAAGYWQWFVFLPSLWRKWKTHRMPGSGGRA